MEVATGCWQGGNVELHEFRRNLGIRHVAQKLNAARDTEGANVGLDFRAHRTVAGQHEAQFGVLDSSFGECVDNHVEGVETAETSDPAHDNRGVRLRLAEILADRKPSGIDGTRRNDDLSGVGSEPLNRGLGDGLAHTSDDIG